MQSTNIAGTQQALALARGLGCAVYNQVSTAYVTGRREGVLREEPADASHVNNRHEESKVAGEHLVAATAGMVTRILWPRAFLGRRRSVALTAKRLRSSPWLTQ